ncbi:MAG: DUF87 domain-containing protein [Chloroflexales bacterium]
MRPLGTALLAVIGLALVAALAAAAVRTLDPPSYSPVAAARDDAQVAELRRLDAQAEALAPLDVALGAFWRVLPAVALAGGLLYLGGLGVAHLARYRHERTPNSAGLLPVWAGDQDAARAALAGFHQARIEDARRALVPHALTFAPHNAYRAEAAALPLLAASEAAAPVPSFAQLLDGGRVGPGNPMLLGYADGRPVEGSWLDLYSCAVGGLSGSGKSWTATFLAAQAALHGSELVILDPHASNAESLAARLAPMRAAFRCAPAESPREMLAAVALVADELARRRGGARGPGLLFIADEFSALQRGELAEPLAALVEGLGQEGRKLGLYAMVCGQVWSAARAGGTELRDSLASAYVHRLRPAQARMLTGMAAADLPGDLLELPAGGAYLLDTAGDFRRVTIPQMTPADVARVAALLGRAPAPAAPAAPPEGRALGFRPPLAVGASVGASVGAATLPLRPHQDAPALTAEDARILAAFLDGRSLSDLAAELNGGRRAGDGYAQAARRVAEVLRRALGARGAAA